MACLPVYPSWSGRHNTLCDYDYITGNDLRYLVFMKRSLIAVVIYIGSGAVCDNRFIPVRSLAYFCKKDNRACIIISGPGGHPGICKVTGRMFSTPSQV